MSLLVRRDLLGQLGHEMRALRSWSNEAHLAFQNVPELRDFIDANLANDATHTGRARVAFAGPNRAVLFGVDSHRAKFCQHKRVPVFADSFLLVKDRATRLELDQYRGDDHDGQRKNRARQCHEPVHGAPCEAGDSLLSSTTGKNQPRRTKHVQRDATRNALVKRSALFNVHFTRKTQLQKLVRGQLSTALTHRDYDAIDVLALDDLVEFLGQADHARIDKT